MGSALSIEAYVLILAVLVILALLRRADYDTILGPAAEPLLMPTNPLYEPEEPDAGADL